MRKYSFSVMLSAVVFASGSLFAADTDTATEPAIKTVLKLKKADGAVESLRFDGALALGQSRGYETDAGTPVLVTRTDEGLRIEMPEKTVTVALPASGGAHEGIEANVEKLVRIEGNGEPTGETKVIVMHRQGDEAIDDAELDALVDDLDTLAEHQENGDGEHQVVIVRKRVEEPAAQ